MDIQKSLRSAQKSVTPERIQLAEWMEKQHLFCAKDVVESFSDVSRASVFRNLKLFCEI